VQHDTLGPRGERLYGAYSALVDGERGLVLLEEACRIADRLDRLDAVLRGDVDSWCRLVLDVRGGESYEVRIDSALTEARQQASVLRQLIASLPLKESCDADSGDSWLDDL
jgi:hypothetical protein